MKWLSLFLGILIGFGLAQAYNHFRGQTTTHYSAWPYPDSLDAIVSAPNSHHVVFENKALRLLRVVVAPHSVEPMHTHRQPSIMFGDNNGIFSPFDIIYKRYILDSSSKKYIMTDSIPQHNAGMAASDADSASLMEPEGPHSITNTSDVPISVYRLEFKTP